MQERILNCFPSAYLVFTRKRITTFDSQPIKPTHDIDFLLNKRIFNYRERSLEIRPVMAKKNLMESKMVQLQQMRENEARRESEREIEKFWYDVLMKDNRARVSHLSNTFE